MSIMIWRSTVTRHVQLVDIGPYSAEEVVTWKTGLREESTLKGEALGVIKKVEWVLEGEILPLTIWLGFRTARLDHSTTTIPDGFVVNDIKQVLHYMPAQLLKEGLKIYGERTDVSGDIQGQVVSLMASLIAFKEGRT